MYGWSLSQIISHPAHLLLAVPPHAESKLVLHGTALQFPIFPRHPSGNQEKDHLGLEMPNCLATYDKALCA